MNDMFVQLNYSWAVLPKCKASRFVQKATAHDIKNIKTIIPPAET